MVVDAHLVDPRDAVSERHADRFRVCFWSTEGAVSTEYELHSHDVRQVIAWAESNAAGRTYVLYAVEDGPDGVHLLQLAGLDPTAPSSKA